MTDVIFHDGETDAPSNPRPPFGVGLYVRAKIAERVRERVLKTETHARTARVLAQSHPSQSNGSTYRSVSGVRSSDGNKTIHIIVARDIWRNMLE